MNARSLGWSVLFLGAATIAIAAVWLQAGSHSGADEPVPPIRSLPEPGAPDADHYLQGLRADQEIPIGTPEALPITTTLLSPAEIETAAAIALDDEDLIDKLANHRYQIVEAEKCGPKEGSCSRLGIFDYDVGVCLHVFINVLSRSVDDVVEGGCSPSEGEISDARAIAESDPRVREVLDSYDDERFVAGRAFGPRGARAGDGHRYVGVRWNLDGANVGAEFVVDLTTRAVCYEC